MVNWVVALVMLVGSFAALYFGFDFTERHRVVTVRLDDPIEPTLKIARETLPYLRMGLNMETARKAAEIIQKISDVSAVAITDTQRVLAFLGAGDDHHKAGGPIITFATKHVLATGELNIVDSKKGLNCPHKNCPLEAAVVVPLMCRGEVAGTVKLYQTRRGHPDPDVVKLAVGIAQLLGVQMELAELDRQVQLVTLAELDALHAQINPHFLFNTLNTIIMFSRTNPETARRLLIRLAMFFRQALKRHGHFNCLREELEYINTYLVLEKARFREKLRITRDIDRSLMDYQVPALSIQPLVENAVKHGIIPKMDEGTVHIEIKALRGQEMLVVVKDDGVGIGSDRLQQVFQPGFGSGNGVGLSNVNERLKSLFGEDWGLRIISEPGKGTAVYMRVPLVKAGSRRDGAVGEA
ncbi:MAG TPA: histidine kinase [Spirochaetia bacterium]|nr:histidine kinase [Spirochaetia bacterium]